MSLQAVAASTLMTIEQIRAERSAGVLIGEAAKFEAAEAMAHRLIQNAEEADRAIIDLRRMAIVARWAAGKRLAELPTRGVGRPRNGTISRRNKAISDAGISRSAGNRLIKLAEVYPEESDLQAMILSIEESGATVNVHRLLLNKGAVPRGRVVKLDEDVHKALLAEGEALGRSARSVANDYLRMMLGVSSKPR